MKKKRFWKTIAPALVIIYAAVFMLFVYPVLGKENPPDEHKNTVILQLWHIDMFEGGIGSREGFLRQQAMAFEKENKGIYILTQTVTLEQLTESLKQGIKPDLLSYAPGIANMLLAELASFEGTFSGYSAFVDSGTIESRLYGVPWCTGGYLVAAAAEHVQDVQGDYIKALASSSKQIKKNKLYSFTAGFSQYNNPLLAAFAANDGLRLAEDSMDTAGNHSQFTAYNKFVSKGYSTFLLGTQRDAVRLSARTDAADFVMQPVKGFTDLVCYISVTGSSRNISAATSYIEYIMSQDAQRQLADIKMFSTVTGGLYSEGIMREMEKNIESMSVLNAFTSPEILLDNRETALSALRGDADSAKKIWEMFP